MSTNTHPFRFRRRHSNVQGCVMPQLPQLSDGQAACRSESQFALSFRPVCGSHDSTARWSAVLPSFLSFPIVFLFFLSLLPFSVPIIHISFLFPPLIFLRFYMSFLSFSCRFRFISCISVFPSFFPASPPTCLSSSFIPASSSYFLCSHLSFIFPYSFLLLPLSRFSPSILSIFPVFFSSSASASSYSSSLLPPLSAYLSSSLSIFLVVAELSV